MRKISSSSTSTIEVGGAAAWLTMLSHGWTSWSVGRRGNKNTLQTETGTNRGTNTAPKQDQMFPAALDRSGLWSRAWVGADPPAWPRRGSSSSSSRVVAKQFSSCAWQDQLLLHWETFIQPWIHFTDVTGGFITGAGVFKSVHVAGGYDFLNFTFYWTTKTITNSVSPRCQYTVYSRLLSLVIISV